MRTAPPSLAAVAERVEGALAELLDAEAVRWRSVDADLAQPFDAIRSLVMAGGKRLRPAFCHWGHVAAGGDPESGTTVGAGAAFELLHAFALFHDDVMDGSSTRRGARTLHLAASDEHHDAGWTGEARRFGEGVAILVGDLAFVYADQLLRGAPAAAMAMWDELRIELNIGQYLDILGTARGERRREVAERICRYKSGKYTIERPLHLGALLAEPDDADGIITALSGYGLPLGDAFQMRDDILGAFGDEALTGKPVGDDLREGKPTPLLAIATAAATPGQLDVLAMVGRADLSPADVADVQTVIVETGALAALETHIDELARQALDAVESPAITDDGRKALIDLAHYVCWRDT